MTDLPRETAPSGLVALPNGDLALCGVVSGTLDRYRYESGGHWKRIGTIATGCRYGAVLINGGRLAYAERQAIRVVSREALLTAGTSSNGS